MRVTDHAPDGAERPDGDDIGDCGERDTHDDEQQVSHRQADDERVGCRDVAGSRPDWSRDSVSVLVSTASSRSQSQEQPFESSLEVKNSFST